MSDQVEQLYRNRYETQHKYTYFLLAAAGAAIAFSVQRTATSTLAWSMIPLGLAVICWGLSFYCGCRFIQIIWHHVGINMDLILIHEGRHSEMAKGDPIAVDMAEKALDKFSKLSGRFLVAQFRLIVLGAIFFIAWHITEMTVRTINKPVSIDVGMPSEK